MIIVVVADWYLQHIISKGRQLLLRSDRSAGQGHGHGLQKMKALRAHHIELASNQTSTEGLNISFIKAVATALTPG